MIRAVLQILILLVKIIFIVIVIYGTVVPLLMIGAVIRYNYNVCQIVTVLSIVQRVGSCSLAEVEVGCYMNSVKKIKN